VESLYLPIDVMRDQVSMDYGIPRPARDGVGGRVGERPSYLHDRVRFPCRLGTKPGRRSVRSRGRTVNERKRSRRPPRARPVSREHHRRRRRRRRTRTRTRTRNGTRMPWTLSLTKSYDIRSSTATPPPLPSCTRGSNRKRRRMTRSRRYEARDSRRF